MSDAAVQRLVQYSMRLLGARIQSSTVSSSADSDHIKQLLLKKGNIPFIIDLIFDISTNESFKCKLPSQKWGI